MKSPSDHSNPTSSKRHHKPVLAVDIDEVLAPMFMSFINWHNRTYGTAFSLPDEFDYYFLQQLTHDTPEKIWEKLEAYFNSPDRRLIEPMDGAAESLKRLSRKYDLVIVTARKMEMRELTTKWVTEHFPHLFKDMKLVGQNDIQMATKQEMLESVGAVALIDDNVAHAARAAQSGMAGILFGDYPWNKHMPEVPGLVRAHTWEEVEKILLDD